MRGFGWLSYVAASVRNAGFRDQREIQEKAHEIAVKLLMGTLFKGYVEKVSGPMDLRFKRSVSNAIRNLVEKEKNRRHHLPTIPITQEVEPASMTVHDDSNNEKIIIDFRRLVRRRLGQLGVAVLDVRLAGGETKSLVGQASLGSPGRWGVKRTVQDLKRLAREYAASLGDPGFLRDIERAMGKEAGTIETRRRATAARQVVGA